MRSSRLYINLTQKKLKSVFDPSNEGDVGENDKRRRGEPSSDLLHCGPCCAPQPFLSIFASVAAATSIEWKCFLSLNSEPCAFWPLNRDRDGVCMRPIYGSREVKQTTKNIKGEGRWKNDDDFLLSSARISSGSHVCVCVCCPSFVAETGFSFFPSSIGTKFRRPPVDSHPYHHPFQIRRHLLSQKETNALNERERNIKRTLFLCVCVCVSRVGHSNSFLKKKDFFSFSRISSICYDKLLLLHGALRVIKNKTKNKQTKRLEKRRMQLRRRKKWGKCVRDPPCYNPPQLSSSHWC